MEKHLSARNIMKTNWRLLLEQFLFWNELWVFNVHLLRSANKNKRKSVSETYEWNSSIWKEKKCWDFCWKLVIIFFENWFQSILPPMEHSLSYIIWDLVSYNCDTNWHISIAFAFVSAVTVALNTNKNVLLKKISISHLRHSKHLSSEFIAKLKWNSARSMRMLSFHCSMLCIKHFYSHFFRFCFVSFFLLEKFVSTY